jgi:hypothetical protein
MVLQFSADGPFAFSMGLFVIAKRFLYRYEKAFDPAERPVRSCPKIDASWLRTAIFERWYF